MANLAASGVATGKLYDVFVAQAINRAAGGAVIAPWDVRYLPDDWLAVVPAMNRNYQAAREGIQRIETAKANYFAGIRRH